MMIRNRFVLKSVAVLLILLTLNNLFFPALSYALTAGPTAPEYTSFEPVDTTDMVNLATGDFTYNIPLLEVPSPEGGYPLSLSYHAGIQPNEEASWVGLGWTLNPGAINRTVNGYPDDHHGVERKVVDDWEGGDRTTFSVGIGLPGASFGLSISRDTYQGFGVGSNFGVGLPIGGDKSPLGVGANAGVGPYGGAYASGGISAGIPVGKGSKSATVLGGSIGIATNFESVSTYAGAGVSSRGASLMGASISSSGLKPRFSVGGASINQANSNAGRITTESQGFSVPIPLGTTGAWLNLGYNYLRYFSNETSTVDTWGTLHPVWKEPTNNSFDSYALLDPDAEGGIVDNDQADKVLGGSMPAFDHYSVTGQGLSGSIQPYLFRDFTTYRQNVHKIGNPEDKLIEYDISYSPATNPFPVAFRFNNDFANTAHFYSDPPVSETDRKAIRFNDTNIKKGTEVHGTQDELTGSKHIEHFTNLQLTQNSVYKSYGVIGYERDYSAFEYNNRKYIVKNQVGSFVITNESGVRYHYSLPVYAFDEYIYSETTDNEDKKRTNKKYHSHPYAYTWLLTAITGPDYVNRGDGKTISEDDWGYWVKFDYTRWKKDYQWRNPGVGAHTDINRKHKNYSYGKKELYYLSSITTRTHTANFTTSTRYDGREATGLTAGGFEPITQLFKDDVENCKAGCPYTNPSDPVACIDACETATTRYPFQMLKLDQISLSKNDSDENQTLRTIVFDYDYSLVPGTLNSYEFGNPNGKKGKLTCKSLKFLGRNKADIIPPMIFKYDDESTTYNMSIKQANPDEHKVIRIDDFKGGNLEEDDLLKFRHEGKTYLTKVSLVTSSSSAEANIVGEGLSDKFYNKTFVQAIKSENYPYEQEAYDMWGCYKSDYEDLGNENLSRLTSASSAQHVDAWSLKEIYTSLGAKISIDYESDQYQRPKLHYFKDLPIQSIEQKNQDQVQITLYTDIDLQDILNSYASIDVSWLIAHPYKETGKSDCTGGCNENDFNEKNSEYYSETTSLNIEFITSQPNGQIVITGYSSNLYNKLTKPTRKKIVTPINCSIVSYDTAGVATHTPEFCNFTKNKEYFQPVVIGGNIFLDDETPLFGGGLRVKQIAISDGDYQTKSLYSYGVNTSTGITSYEPTGIAREVFTYPEDLQDYFFCNNCEEPRIEYENRFKKTLYAGFSDLLANAREIPPPGVIYERVTITEQAQHGAQEPAPVGGASVYTFQTFEENMIQRDTQPCNGCTDNRQGRAVTFRDFSARVGALKKVEQYGSQGQLLSESVNHYLYEEADPAHYKETLLERYHGQGLITQMTTERRTVEIEGKDYNQALLTAKEEYPTVIVGSTTIDHKTGVKTSTRNLAFDFYSGVPTEVLNKDSYGNKYVSVTTPAYQLYEAMGPKVRGSSNKHMLTQEAEKITYKINSDFDPTKFPQTDYQPEGLLSASVQTWSDQVPVYNRKEQPITDQQANIWRKHRNFSWIGSGVALQGDGTARIEDFKLFEAWQPDATANRQWEQQSEITRYDPYSHALEARDLNDNFAATRMDYQQRRTIATVANARYDEFAYSGAEDMERRWEGGVTLDNLATATSRQAHTGLRSVVVPGKQKGFVWKKADLDDTRPYRASVWVYFTESDQREQVQLYATGGITQTAQQTNVQAGSWHLITLDVAAGQSALEIGCENLSARQIYFDDFRVHPLDAAMISYVYDERTDQLTHILNAENFYTRFEYDAMGRLVATFQEIQHPVERQISEQIYHYKQKK